MTAINSLPCKRNAIIWEHLLWQRPNSLTCSLELSPVLQPLSPTVVLHLVLQSPCSSLHLPQLWTPWEMFLCWKPDLHLTSSFTFFKPSTKSLPVKSSSMVLLWCFAHTVIIVLFTLRKILLVQMSVNTSRQHAPQKQTPHSITVFSAPKKDSHTHTHTYIHTHMLNVHLLSGFDILGNKPCLK